MKKLLILIGIGLFVLSCQTPSTVFGDFNSQKNTIISNQWLLQDESGTVISYNGEAVSMQFTDDGALKASGFSGCNRYFSTVVLLPESIQFQKAGVSMMACPEMEGETMFLDLLSQINRYEVSQTELKLYQGKILLLRFKKQ